MDHVDVHNVDGALGQDSTRSSNSTSPNGMTSHVKFTAERSKRVALLKTPIAPLYSSALTARSDRPDSDR
jgi:hypothetical protein